LQNHTFWHRPQSSSLPPRWPHARQELAAGASAAEFTPGSVELGPAASTTRSAISVLVRVIAPSVDLQFAPEWPCLAATTWHWRLQNHTVRHRPQRSSLHPLLPQAWHEVAAGAMDEALTSAEAISCSVAAFAARLLIELEIWWACVVR